MHSYLFLDMSLTSLGFLGCVKVVSVNQCEVVLMMKLNVLWRLLGMVFILILLIALV